MDAAVPGNGSIEVGVLLMGLGGGLALFLFGMRHMTDALKVAAGESMKALIARLSANRFSATIAGASKSSCTNGRSFRSPGETCWDCWKPWM